MRHQSSASTPLHHIETADYLTHVTWADDFTLVASTKADLEGMVKEFRVLESEAAGNPDCGWLRSKARHAVPGLEPRYGWGTHGGSTD